MEAGYILCGLINVESDIHIPLVGHGLDRAAGGEPNV